MQNRKKLKIIAFREPTVSAAGSVPETPRPEAERHHLAAHDPVRRLVQRPDEMVQDAAVALSGAHRCHAAMFLGQECGEG